jgi:two-component system chemotaxis sensor kinase CheA
MAVFERLTTDRNGFIEFCDEADEIVRRIERGEASDAELKRQVHTLKGNAAIFGVESIAGYCHALESQMIDDNTLPTPEERRDLATRWRAFTERINAMLGWRDLRRIEVSDDDFQRVLAVLRQNRPAAEVLQMVTAWSLEPISRRFERVGEQANRLARQMGKAIQVDIDDRGVRLDPRRWAPFWSAFVHAVRNAIDHGVEHTGERLQAGKPEIARVTLGAKLENGSLIIEIRDDGRGVAWDRVRERANRLHLPSGTAEELTEALFADGVSTKEEVSDLSGRGVGLSALRAAALAAGGHVTIVSEPPGGTCVRFTFPHDEPVEPEHLPIARAQPRLRNATS